MPLSSDDLIAFLLISTWQLTSGRQLRDVPPGELTERELIDFWADDPTPAPGTTGVPGAAQTPPRHGGRGGKASAAGRRPAARRLTASAPPAPAPDGTPAGPSFEWQPSQ